MRVVLPITTTRKEQHEHKIASVWGEFPLESLMLAFALECDEAVLFRFLVI